MNFRQFSVIFFLTILSGTVFSCKEKEEEEIIRDSFSGTVSFDLPSFVQPGDVYVLDPSVVKRLDTDTKTDGLLCAWSVAELKINDTVRLESSPASASYKYTFTVPDTLCNITVKCVMAAEGYTQAAASRSAMIVKARGEGKSLTGTEFQDAKKVFTDARDNKQYHYSSIAGLDWMAENLAYEAKGKALENAPAMTDIFGLYYTWTEACTVCPEGWRLPSNADFKALSEALTGKKGENEYDILTGAAGDLMTNAYLNTTKLWEYWPAVRITNRSFLSVLPCGYCTIAEGAYTFKGLTKYAAFWTSEAYNGEQAYYRNIHVEQPDILVGTGHKDMFAANVRCVRASL